MSKTSPAEPLASRVGARRADVGAPGPAPRTASRKVFIVFLRARGRVDTNRINSLIRIEDLEPGTKDLVARIRSSNSAARTSDLVRGI